MANGNKPMEFKVALSVSIFAKRWSSSTLSLLCAPPVVPFRRLTSPLQMYVYACQMLIGIRDYFDKGTFLYMRMCITNIFQDDMSFLFLVVVFFPCSWLVSNIRSSLHIMYRVAFLLEVAPLFLCSFCQLRILMIFYAHTRHRYCSIKIPC